jgi:Tol biopolymer transport system component
MRSDVSFERLLGDWLETDGPQDVPAFVVEAALADAARLPQVRGWLQRLRPDVGPAAHPVRRGRLALALVLAALLLVTMVGGLLVGQRRGLLGTPGLIVYSVSGRLTLANADGSDPRPVRGARSFGSDPRWSPDGRRLAFWTGADPDAPEDLIVVDDPAGSPRVVARALRYPFEPSWSPDSRRIVIDAADPSSPGPGFLYDPRTMVVVDAETGASRPLETGGLNPWSPRWSPAGDEILFWGQGFDTEDGLYVIRPDGTDLRQVARIACRAYTVCFGWTDWAPDGSRISYSDGDPTYDVWTVGIDGTSLRNLSIGHGNALNPSWSPDGTRIAWFESATVFDVDAAADGRVVVANADGSERTVVTGAYVVPPTVPRWSPDGRSILVPVYDVATKRADRLGMFPIAGGEPNLLRLDGELASDAGWQRRP